jgi:toxin CcdB
MYTPIRPKASKSRYPYLVDIQSPHLFELATRIVIPLGRLSAFGNQTMQGLTPEVTFDGQKLLLLTPQISSVPTKQLNNPAGSLAHFRDQIVATLHFAITGI